MPGPAERAVDEDLSRPGVKVSQDLLKENGFVAFGRQVHSSQTSRPEPACNVNYRGAESFG